MFNNSNSNSVSIPIPEDESDELSRKRVHMRRKRKKLGHRGNTELGGIVLRKLVKHWTILIIVIAAAMLIFEATVIGRKPDLKKVSSEQLRTPSKEGGNNSQIALGKETPHGNLNRLDPPRCLQLLPPEELEHLDVPVEEEEEESGGPVNQVLYTSENDASFVGGNATLSQQRAELTRFNLFTGNQTLEQRDTSFEVKEIMMVHCGFYSLNGGFKISDKDKNYMQACKVAVSTCAFGGGDDLYQPIGMSAASLKKVCYVAFWDEITLRAQELVGHRIGENGFIGKWRVVLVKDLPFVDQRLNGKIPKEVAVGMLSHRLFPQAKYSIWIDSKSQIRRDPLGLLEALLWRPNSVFAISEHGARSSVYDEAKAVVKKNKAKPEEVEVQLNQYRKDGLPEDKRFIGKKALCEASVIVRKHTPLTNLLTCLWFNEVVRFTSRDQLSFPYVLWRLKAFKNINMFRVCTRKDLVNSMGHIRKAKPLQS